MNSTSSSPGASAVFIDVGRFLSTRRMEITALTDLINENTRVTSIFQRLPRSMRRRAMSHNVKRVPRNLRDAHKRQLEKNKALKSGRRPRKYYRKHPKNYYLEYKKRQQANGWLKTHIWHAKRFRMISKWGYRLAESSYNKTFRACNRAMSSHCLLQDISYLCCIEICGPQHILLDSFKNLISPECGLTIAAKCWLNGNREGTVTMYHKNMYPYNVIGDVTFMWKPSTDPFRILWIWCHPALHEELKQEFIEVFNLKIVESHEDVEMKNVKSSKKTSQASLPEYVNEYGVRVVLLKNHLNRFRLIGPLSNAVLTKSLHAAELFHHHLQPSSDNWWNNYREKHDNELTALKLLEKYAYPSQFPPHIILGENIIDPRLFLKRIRQKAIPENTIESCISLPSSTAECAIWDADIRNYVERTKFTNAEINKLRGQLLVPGHDEQMLTKINTVIPIMLVQRPGVSKSQIKLNYGNGWDIIFTSEWSMPIWLSLILCGAKPGGLRENKTFHFESKNMSEFPPDSKAGVMYYEELKISDQDLYFKKPPNKRINYIKNGFPTPFHYPWTTLTAEWVKTDNNKPFYVLRNRSILFELNQHLENFKKNSKLKFVSEALNDRCLVPVTISLLGKGHLTPFSHICIPKDSDLLNKNNCPVETKHSDPNKLARKLFRRQHCKELKRLRKDRKELKKNSVKKFPIKITKRKQSCTEKIVKEYAITMRDLWIPPNCNKVRYHCAREISGFVINAGFSFLESKISGQGFVTLQALIYLCDLWHRFKCSSLVLTRTPDSLCYRYGNLRICVQ